MNRFNREIEDNLYWLEKQARENKNVYEYLVEVYGAEAEDNLQAAIVMHIANMYDFDIVDRLA